MSFVIFSAATQYTFAMIELSTFLAFCIAASRQRSRNFVDHIAFCILCVLWFYAYSTLCFKHFMQRFWICLSTLPFCVSKHFVSVLVIFVKFSILWDWRFPLQGNPILHICICVFSAAVNLNKILFAALTTAECVFVC